MDQLTNPRLRDPSSDSATPARAEAASEQLVALSSLLHNLEDGPRTVTPGRAASENSHQNQLIQVRLGVASSLFTALRAKHAPTAEHSLRVALACSSWALSLDVTDEQRDEIEVAALLHDVGKIAVPDQILQKPCALTPVESAVVERHRRFGLEILNACSASYEILDIVHHCGAWFDGSRAGFEFTGDELPLGARMLSIVDAFDAMTTDCIYRRAISRERAMAELFECASTQFDPHLVNSFCALLEADQVKFTPAVANRWLAELHPSSSNALWCLGRLKLSDSETSARELFQHKLVDSMLDAVVFVDTTMRVLLWNRGAERLTGIPAASVTHKQWLPSLVQMRDEDDQLIHDADCPVAHVIQSRVQNMRRLVIAGRGGAKVSVDAHLVPVIGKDGVPQGATLLLHDASSQITLEERVESLHVKAAQDPLTKLANRAEFDRVHEQFVRDHLMRLMPCSLIICDLDFFKRINDNYGHQAGDEALVGFAALLQRHHRPGDLVARYGGEEFVMLCKDCDNATSTARAEEIRRELASLPQPALAGKCITASFGVTELQDGDTPETMLRRADRALLQAKELGRNAVVQLGSGISGQPDPQKPAGWMSWRQRTTPDQLLERSLITAVPLNVVVEKLRGFVADHHAEITKIREDHVALKIEGPNVGLLRRGGDRPVPFIIELAFSEVQVDSNGRMGGKTLRTQISVVMRPIRVRDRRRRDILERARQLLVSLKSYLMAFENTVPSALPAADDPAMSMLSRAKQIVAPLFAKKHGPHDE